MATDLKDRDERKDAEDPWEKLSPEERKKAERHLFILYVFMGLMVVTPFIVFFILKK